MWYRTDVVSYLVEYFLSMHSAIGFYLKTHIQEIGMVIPEQWRLEAWELEFQSHSQ